MSTEDISLVEFGALKSAVSTLEVQVADMQKDVKELLALANKSKGGFWVGMSISAGVGSIVTAIVSHIPWR